MFIQTQQTSSVNGSSSSSSSSSSNTVHHPGKKRKLDYNVSQPVIQHALVQSTGDYQLDNTGLQQRYSVNGANTAFSSLHNNNALQKSSPNQQTLVRASTIKLLDSYHRVGQKVGVTFCVTRYFAARSIVVVRQEVISRSVFDPFFSLFPLLSSLSLSSPSLPLSFLFFLSFSFSSLCVSLRIRHRVQR